MKFAEANQHKYADPAAGEVQQHLPKLISHGGVAAPAAPVTLEQTGVDPSVLCDLVLKLANSVPRLTTEWAAERLCLPHSVTERLFSRLREDQHLEILGQNGPLTHRYHVTDRGRERAQRLMEISGYIGPAPVSLEAYGAMLQWQIAQQVPPNSDDVAKALSPLVLSPGACDVAALAATSGRSLFLFGPPGNGKTSLAMLMGQVLVGELWIPHCINVESNIIRIYDLQCHQLAPKLQGPSNRIDRRWLRVRRPIIVAGGEMTIAELDLTYSTPQRFYEAPPHVKANGGLFLLDDFGRQRIDPTDLLNRWIIPLEQQIDYLTLVTGQKIRIPFQLLLILATNLSESADPAFLRRIGYRIHMDKPDEERYAEIFRRCAERLDLSVENRLVSSVLNRYKKENRELRSCEPRDLLERCRDICKLRQQRFALSQELMDEAWRAYFGET